ncbi:alpha/beta hydrolase [Mycobacterium xenopi RIVM700367]|uniref:alpha/beta fold hydrolase n=1 Tax=Mycobacterium xenopi TaxID=1789 RepID=UPI00025ACCAE|nr:alpha/beta fold hydrolase [Mycobacterium xenopi]EID13405.1 alpha/beta hydrolase [Mycobacterium xenopi RIVM700367]
MDQYRRGNLVFDVIGAGPTDGPVVVLLHGFPQFNTSWSKVIDRLSAAGYRCLAPNQRGYSPGARPTRRRDYRMTELIGDVRALIDASGAGRVHLVGHDWGAGVAWGAAAEMPDRLATVSALSVPHPAAFLRALVTSRQVLASWYMYVFQLPALPELFLLGGQRNTAQLAKALRSAGQSADAADRDARAMAEPGVLTAALNWYRAMPVSGVRSTIRKASVPTLYVWSDGDTAVLGTAARNCGRYVTGEYRFEILQGVSHWIPDERPDAVADLLLEWFAAHPV